MSLETYQMEDNAESDYDMDYEVIVVNPNILYESDDDDSEVEDLSQKENITVDVQTESTIIEDICKQEVNQEVELKAEITLGKVDEVSCDSIVTPTMDEDSSMNSNDMITSPKKVRKKLNLQEYKLRRANEIPQKPLFDVPRRIAAYELCDAPASLPLLVLPNDPNWTLNRQNFVKTEPVKKSLTTVAYNPDHYEEIISVSMGCNTEVTIPPTDDDEQKPASMFLKNIVNNLNRDNMESLLNSSTSLFSSIQAVVQKKCVSTGTETEQVGEPETDLNGNGENKTIMHLRKDRLRPLKSTIGLQTDNISLFPPLLLSPSLIFNRIRNARNYRRKVSRSRSRSRSFSPSDSESDHLRYHNNNRCSRSQHSTHTSSVNSSESCSDSESDSSNDSSSADSLKRFNERQNFKFYNRNQSNQGYKAYKEERKIVYIGGLEEETTKDEIRRKFLNYGTIKKISFHEKEDGLRYGFVTFAEASCAYEAIDKCSKDPLISKYDIRFGGRRKFCKQTYADLDSIQGTEYAENQKATKDLSFEELLKMAQKKIGNKK